MKVNYVERAAALLSGFKKEGVRVIGIVIQSPSGERFNVGADCWTDHGIAAWSKKDWAEHIQRRAGVYSEVSAEWTVRSIRIAFEDQGRWYRIESTELERFDRLIIDGYPLRECYLTPNESVKIRGVADVVKMTTFVERKADRLTEVESDLPKYLRKKPGYSSSSLLLDPGEEFMY